MECTGVILRKLREINKFTLKQAAQKLERSAGWLSEIENEKGNARIDATEFERIVRFYGGEPYRKQFGAWIAKSKVNEQKSKILCFDGPILRYLRNKAQLTLAQVSVRTNLSQGYLADIENGNRRIDQNLRDLLLGIYGYSPASFRNFTSKDKRAANIPVRYKLNIVLRKLNDTDIERIFSFAINSLKVGEIHE